MAFMDDPGKTKMFGKIEKEDRAALPLSPIVSDASPTKFFFSRGASLQIVAERLNIL